VRKKKTTKQFIEEAINIHGNKYIYDGFIYYGAHIKSIIRCSKHGLFNQTAHSHLRGEGCPKCGSESSCKSRRTTYEKFIKQAKSKNGDYVDYSIVKKSSFRLNNVIDLICPEHGKFQQIAKVHLATTGTGCQMCAGNISLVSRRWLASIGIPDDEMHREVRISGTPYRVDGFIPETKTIYEFYGKIFHSSLKKKQYDEKRINIFKYLGYEVVIKLEDDFLDEEKKTSIKNIQPQDRLNFKISLETSRIIIDLFNDKKSISYISKKLDISEFRIKNLIKSRGIKLRTVSETNCSTITNEDIVKASLLYNNGVSLSKITEKFNISTTCLSEKLKSIGVSVKKQGARELLNESECLEIIDKYNTGFDCVDLSKIYKRSIECIRRYLLKNGVKLRSRSEAMKLAYNRGKIQKPSKYKRRHVIP